MYNSFGVILDMTYYTSLYTSNNIYTKRDLGEGETIDNWHFQTNFIVQTLNIFNKAIIMDNVFLELCVCSKKLEAIWSTSKIKFCIQWTNGLAAGGIWL